MSAPDLLGVSTDGAESYYRFPFGSEPAWRLGRGNYDDPGNAHDAKNPNGAQSYSYDFCGPEGTPIRAARAGLVIHVEDDMWSTHQIPSDDPHVFHHQTGNLGLGNGNWIVVKHLDGTNGCYNHMRSGSLAVRKGEYVARGRVLGECGCTGQSSEPHVHFDVHPTFTEPVKFGDAPNWDHPMRIWFHDRDHAAWRPITSDKIVSDNTSTATFYGLFADGGEQQSWVTGMTFAELDAARAQLAAASPRQVMKSFDAYAEVHGAASSPTSLSVDREVAAVFGPGTESQDFVWGLSYQAFCDHWVAQGKLATPRFMLDFATYEEGGKRLFAGLFGPGKAGQSFVAGLTGDALAARWIELGKGPNPAAMLTFETYVEGGQRKFAALFGPGALGQGLETGIDRQTFLDHWRKAGIDGKGVVAFARYDDGAGERFAVLVGPQAHPGQSFLGPLPADSLVRHAQRAAVNGQRLLALRAGTGLRAG